LRGQLHASAQRQRRDSKRASRHQFSESSEGQIKRCSQIVLVDDNYIDQE
jgi:hypothetical protein